MFSKKIFFFSEDSIDGFVDSKTGKLTGGFIRGDGSIM